MAMPPAPAGITPRLRLLPTLMFLAALFFTVKVGMLWQSADAPSAGGPFAVAGAAAKSAGAEKPPAKAAAATPAAAAPAPAAAFPTPPPATPEPATEPAAEAAQAPAFSPAEVDVLRQLAARREQLEARVRELDKREALLKAAESRIDAKATALKELQAEVSRLLKAHDERQDEKVASLARLYASMKPKDAAAILQTLELEPLLLVTERIKERKLAPILAEMSPAKARDLTTELVRKRKVEAAARPVQPSAEARPAR
jgi:flagellar motility protein MotE (MotC chaperone)